MSSFSHDPLDLAKPTVRLLRLRKGSTGPIHCDLFQVQMDDERGCGTSYEALSYVWGSSDLSRYIRINGKKLSITENLYVALSHVRVTENDRVIWVDAVCIDQTNHKERGHQVQQMGNVYRQARQVIVWLGQSTYDTDRFMIMMQRLQQKMERYGCCYRNQIPKHGDGTTHRRQFRNFRDFEETSDLNNNSQPPDLNSDDESDNENKEALFAEIDLRSARECLLEIVRETEISGITYSPEGELIVARNGLIDILNRAWFRRVWILQEVANASAVSVHCGSKSIPGFYFAVALKLMNSVLIRNDEASVGAHAQSILEIMPTRRWTTDSWWKNHGGRTMYSLLKHFGQSEATDPRDIIYALRGISTDSNNPRFPAVDYEISDQLLAERMAAFMFDCELSSWARLHTISDLVAQLDWLLAASMTAHLELTRNADFSQLPKQGRVRIRSTALQIPLETGHWKLVDRILSPLTESRVQISRKAVLQTYRKCVSSVLGCMKLRAGVSNDEILFAALQNPHMGPQLIDECWEDINDPEYAAECGVNALRLLWHKPAPKDDFHHGSRAVHATCLAALVSKLIRSRQKLTEFNHSWKNQQGETLLGHALTTGNIWLAQKLLVLGADPSMKSMGWTPLMLAAMHAHDGTEEVVTTLLKSGVDSRTIVQGQTALSLAKTNGNAEVVRLLSEWVQVNYTEKWSKDSRKRKLEK